MLYQCGPTLLRIDGLKITIVNPSVNPISSATEKSLILRKERKNKSENLLQQDTEHYIYTYARDNNVWFGFS